MGELGAILEVRLEGSYKSCRIPYTARITFSLDEIERWEKNI